jgi:hypothetical protein
LEFLSPEQYRVKYGDDPVPVTARAGEAWTSKTLILSPESCVDVPVWYGPPGAGAVEADHLMRLGASSQLVERLRAWNADQDSPPGGNKDPRDVVPGSPLSMRLAQHLQRELTDHDVYLEVGGRLCAARDLRP